MTAPLPYAKRGPPKRVLRMMALEKAILEFLADEPKSTNEIADHFKLVLSYVRKRLDALRDEGAVTSERVSLKLTRWSIR